MGNPKQLPSNRPPSNHPPSNRPPSEQHHHHRPRSSALHPAQEELEEAEELGNNKKKLYCICRKPYDNSKFYVGCDLCSNWFHGDCVGITENMSQTMSEFVCQGCSQARSTQELFCLCQQPYDEAQFYICCDRCQDWFHGRCV